MDNKINIAELLKECPKGMELDCTVYDNVTFGCIMDGNCYPIQIQTPEGNMLLSEYGCMSLSTHSKCVIFPKGKTTWEGFKTPFKDGDILISGLEDNPFIFKRINGLGNAQCYCAISCFGQLILNNDNWTCIKGCRLATEEEKSKLFQAIKDNGYRWNAETKTLKKLPKFKVGNRIRHKENIEWVCTIRRVTDRYYVDGHPMCYTLLFDKQDEYELVQNKFDINTLKPFDKVLVRTFYEEWKADFFSHYSKEADFPYSTVGKRDYYYCIPYEGNEHLCGTTNDCDEYYKTW